MKFSGAFKNNLCHNGAMAEKIIVVGGGTFGVSTALELRRRGYAVQLLEPGPLPHPDAASTDISKVIRLDYGADEFYMALMEECLALWREWNEEWGETVFHETGVLYLAGQPMKAGDFEYDSLQILEKRGHKVDMLDPTEVARRFPAWNADHYPEGYYNPQGGWAPSGRVVALLAKAARAAGVEIVEGARMAALLEEGGRVKGILAEDDAEYRADGVVVAAGAWTPYLLPFLQDVMWPTAQPVMHFRPQPAAPYEAAVFPVWTADVDETGWYGFPVQADGTLKVANHGPGWRRDPRRPRELPKGTEARFRAFFEEALPGLAKATRIGERMCFYCDTFDGDFWIARDPERPGLVVSTGGSGHAFKFTPLLGRITVDVIEGAENPWAERFAWRELSSARREASRHGGAPARK